MLSKNFKHLHENTLVQKLGFMSDERQPDLNKILNRASKLGAEYADARFQTYDYELVTVENKQLKSYASRRLGGVGIRAIIKGAVGYASTSDLSSASLEKTLNTALKIAKSIITKEPTFKPPRPSKANAKLPIKIDPADISPEEKVTVTLDVNKAGWISDEIKNAITLLGIAKDQRAFVSTEDAEVSVETCLVGLAHMSVCRVGEGMENVMYWKSDCAGFEFINAIDTNTFASDISKLAIHAAQSKTCPAGTYPVVLEPEAVGLILHEAFGHASEADLVVTNSSILTKKLDTQVASEGVTMVDEGVVEGGYFYPYDDEGTKKGRTIVVENGILKNYLHDVHSARKLDAESTGNGRAQDFENTPIVRQTNFYMQPGDFTVEELIEDVDFGIYVGEKGLKGGEVDPGNGTFTFGVGPTRAIRNGELAETFRGVVISGSILETLKTVDAVGKDLKMSTLVFGGCGKSGQSVFVGDGGPPVRIRKMTVGGR